MSPLEPGIAGEGSVRVTPENSTRHLGDIAVFTTPNLVQLLEGACMRSVAPLLAAGEATVGVGINLRHLAATPVGMTVIASSKLTAVKGRVLTFAVEAHDQREKVAEGTHWRAVVKVTEVAERLRRKQEAQV
jgi:fluoroacetyl-CoA thioesterase